MKIITIEECFMNPAIMVAAVAAHPGQFLAFATLSINDPQAAAEELKKMHNR